MMNYGMIYCAVDDCDCSWSSHGCLIGPSLTVTCMMMIPGRRYVRTDAIHSTQSSAPQGSSPRLAQLHVRTIGTILQVSSKEDSDDQHVPSLLNASGTRRYAACHIPQEVRLSFLIPGGIHTCTCTLGILSCDVTLNSGTCGLMT